MQITLTISIETITLQYENSSYETNVKTVTSDEELLQYCNTGHFTSTLDTITWPDKQLLGKYWNYKNLSLSLWQHKSDRFQIEFSIEVKFESLSGGYKVIQICWEILSQYTWTFEQFKWNDCKKCNQNDLSMAHRISVCPKFKPFT